MAKKFVRQYDKYTNKSYYVADMMKRHCKGNISDLLNWLEEKVAPYEKIDIHSWADSMYYIVIEDTRDGFEMIEDARLGFTVNVEDDEIFWSVFNEKYPHLSRGGNCFVRSGKWKDALSKKFGKTVKENVHWYENCYPK